VYKKDEDMKHGRKAQQQRRRFRTKVLQHPQNIYLYEELKGKTVVQLKEILQTLTEEEEKRELEKETL
tara:strand:- start:1672 stop:1875 length:204 start_codon:yes stop_codon:yes gene_type:complete